MAATTYLAVGFGLMSLAYYLYSLLIPRPLPGIPFQAWAARQPLGDIPELKRVGALTREPSLGMFGVARKLGVPVCQLLLVSFARPLIVLDDAREIEDILVRRNREFDRSDLTAHLFKQLLPHCTIAQLTTPELRAQKRLWSDVMSAHFLRRVVAPNIHLAAIDLIELWRIKAARAAGVPFEVTKDFNHAALDAIWVAILGSQLGIVRREIEKLEPAETPAGRKGDAAYVWREEAAVAVQESMEFANEVVNAGLDSIWPAITFFFIRMSPKYRRFRRVRDNTVQQMMARAVDRFQRVEAHGDKDGAAAGEGREEGDEFDTCAMDLVLRREVMTAKKAGRPVPDPTKDPAMLQELWLLLLAGHDSTANTLGWFVKIMAGYQDAQATLRRALQAAFPTRCPDSAAAILDADIPYLDASVEETVRVAGTAGLTVRRALVDTEVLGCRVPAGANVLLNTRVMWPPLDVPEGRRSATSQAAKARRPRGGLEGDAGRDIEVYEPRRWLTKDESGKEVFDASALPSLTFGGGLRGCFGKRLAMQELKIIMVHLILNFEFLPLPDELTDMAAIEMVFRQPKLCHVRLKAL